jgi:VWFA-related protein
MIVPQMRTTTKFRRARICAAGAAVGVALALTPAIAVAQAPPGGLKPNPGLPIQQGRPQKPIRVKVEVVTAPVVVRDANGDMVTDLDQLNFRIFDNGVEQRIEHFDMGGDALSVVLLVETSNRVAPMLPAIRKAGIVFTQSILGGTGEGAVIGFGNEVRLVQPFTTNHDKLEKSIAKLTDDGSASRLYDAMTEAVALLRNRPRERRRVIVAISEAADAGSTAKLGMALRAAELENITIYTVGISTAAAEWRAPLTGSTQAPEAPEGVMLGPPAPGTPQTPSTPDGGVSQVGVNSGDLLALVIWAVQHGKNLAKGHALEEATLATGGEHVATRHDKAIEPALDRIGGELHAQYTLSYHPTDSSPGGFHEIKVLVDRPKTTVKTRPGYYLPPDDDSGNTN